MLDHRLHGHDADHVHRVHDIRIEIDEHDLPRIVLACAAYRVYGGETLLCSVLAEDGENDGRLVLLVGDDRHLATCAVNRLVRDAPIASRAWKSVERAIERHRESLSEGNRDLFAERQLHCET